MTVAPPFFLAGMVMTIGYFLVIIPLALFISKVGSIYTEAKLSHPFKTVFLIAFLTFVLQLPLAVIVFARPILATSLPPFLFWFYIVGFVVILFRLDGELLNMRKAKIAFCLSGACVLWLTLVEKAVLYVVSRPGVQ